MNKKERGLLINLIEEANEVSQMAAKSLRFGLMSYNPNDHEKICNAELLGKEIGNMRHIVKLMLEDNVVRLSDLNQGQREKKMRLLKYPLIVER